MRGAGVRRLLRGLHNRGGAAAAPPGAPLCPHAPVGAGLCGAWLGGASFLFFVASRPQGLVPPSGAAASPHSWGQPAATLHPPCLPVHLLTLLTHHPLLLPLPLCHMQMGPQPGAAAANRHTVCGRRRGGSAAARACGAARAGPATAGRAAGGRALAGPVTPACSPQCYHTAAGTGGAAPAVLRRGVNKHAR